YAERQGMASKARKSFGSNEEKSTQTHKTPIKKGQMLWLWQNMENIMIANQSLLIQALEKANTHPSRNARQSPTVTSPLHSYISYKSVLISAPTSMKNIANILVKYYFFGVLLVADVSQRAIVFLDGVAICVQPPNILGCDRRCLSCDSGGSVLLKCVQPPNIPGCDREYLSCDSGGCS
ncbi:14428_t:CDS:2, partial [Acaulospora morrowiae]